MSEVILSVEDLRVGFPTEDGVVQAVHVGASEGMEAKLRKNLDALLEGKSLAPTGGNQARAEPL